VRPSVWTVLIFMTISNFVGCSTSRSAGLAPFKIFDTADQKTSKTLLDRLRE
jgi:hypothetical protein